MALLPADERPPTEPPTEPQSTADTPVFTRLAADWRAAGRIVPGEPDWEWAQLVAGRRLSGGRRR